MMSLTPTYNDRLKTEVLKAQENERSHLARELHDEMGQYLTAIHMHASILKQLKESQSIHESADVIDQLACDMLDLIHGKLEQLRGGKVTDFKHDLATQLQQLVNDWQLTNSEISITTSINGDLSDVGDEILHSVYRVTQECLTNISRHAKASNVTVTVDRVANFVALDISDDGMGFDLDKTVTGFGVKGMKERIAICNGRYSIETSKGAGTHISVSLPCHMPKTGVSI
jgi:two-component system, NarL family, sensor histidine kinase UhpB